MNSPYLTDRVIDSDEDNASSGNDYNTDDKKYSKLRHGPHTINNSYANSPMRSRSALTGIKIKQKHPIEVKKI